MEIKMQKLLEDIVKSIVDKPDEVQVNINESENTIVYELNVGEGDLGKDGNLWENKKYSKGKRWVKVRDDMVGGYLRA